MKIGKLDAISLTSSTVAVSTYAEYVATTTYDAANNVRVSYESDGTTLRYPAEEYTAIDGSNTGNYPPTSPTHWALIGSENRWKMFDYYVGTQTEDTTTIEFVLDSSGKDIIGLFNLVAKSITFELTAYGSVKISETVDLTTAPESAWYSYFFDPIEFKLDTLWSFASYDTSSLKVTITYYTGSAAKCGMVAIGKQYNLGNTIYEPSISIIDYSIKETDTLGRTYLSQGNFVKQVDVDFWIENTQVDAIRKTLTAIRGVPAIFDCNNNSEYTSLMIYGFYRSFDIVIPGPVKSKCAIDIEGLI